MTNQQGGRGRGSVGDEVREGIRAGLGILGALKDAIEETVQDMMDRGELSQDRAREAVKTTMDRAQAAFEDARTRLDLVPRREFEVLQAEVAELRRRVDAVEGHRSTRPTEPGDRGGPGPNIPVSEG